MQVAKVLPAFILSFIFLVTTSLADEAKHFPFIAKRTVEDVGTVLHRDVLVARLVPTGAWLNSYLVRQPITGPKATGGNNNRTCPLARVFLPCKFCRLFCCSVCINRFNFKHAKTKKVSMIRSMRRVLVRVRIRWRH